MWVSGVQGPMSFVCLGTVGFLGVQVLMGLGFRVCWVVIFGLWYGREVFGDFGQSGSQIHLGLSWQPRP